jgi:hypothetical protein
MMPNNPTVFSAILSAMPFGTIFAHTHTLGKPVYFYKKTSAVTRLGQRRFSYTPHHYIYDLPARVSCPAEQSDASQTKLSTVDMRLLTINHFIL